MIGFLRGKIIEIHQDIFTLESNDVGYEIHTSEFLAQKFLPGDFCELFIQTIVREDAITLFGFMSSLEKQFFNTLLTVNGVGPKMAAKILATTSPQHLIEIIEGGNVVALTELPKVGKKTAEQIVLTLKGKLAQKFAHLPSTAKTETRPVRSEIVSALVNLGFRIHDVEKAIEKLPDDVEFQNGVRMGLQVLTAGF